MHLFYCPDIKESTAILNPDESAHCVRVLRLSKGENVQVTDGKGNLFNAVIAIPDARECRLEITGILSLPDSRNFRLNIAIAPTKSIDRFEWFVEKAVEIGIDTITPIICSRSERRVLNTDRLYKLVISTMKQSRVTHRPAINPLTPVKVFLENYSGPVENRMIAHCETTNRSELRSVFIPGKDAIVLIGPEGDFTPQEIEIAMSKQFIPVTLGNNRLRTETAGIVACCLMNF